MMTKTDLDKVLSDHALWIKGDGGVRADLSWADLSRANLFGVDLSGADLSRADLSGANLFGADLSWANLFGADLSRANLSEADLSGANLFGANLSEADLSGANLFGAKLEQTCLDPNNCPNAEVAAFAERDGDFVIGYRTRKAGHIDKYRDGRFYSADWFSTGATECHPGLYLWPSLAGAKDWSPNEPLIKVRTRASEVHKAGTKYRCRWFEVLGSA